MPPLAAACGQGLWPAGTRAPGTLSQETGVAAARPVCPHRHTPPAPPPRPPTPVHRSQAAPSRPQPDGTALREARLPATVSTGATAKPFRPTALGPGTTSRNHQSDTCAATSSSVWAPGAEREGAQTADAGVWRAAAAPRRQDPGRARARACAPGCTRARTTAAARHAPAPRCPPASRGAPSPGPPPPVTFRRSCDIRGRMRFTPYRTTSAAETDLPAARPGSCPLNTSSGGTGTGRLRGGVVEPARLGLPHPGKVRTGSPLSAGTVRDETPGASSPGPPPRLAV